MTRQEKIKHLEEKGFVRIAIIRAMGFTEEDKKDEDWSIRLEAFRNLGFTEEDKKDEDWSIRLEAYLNLGFTEETKKDEDWLIRREAENFFKIKEELDTLGVPQEASIPSTEELMEKVNSLIDKLKIWINDN